MQRRPTTVVCVYDIIKLFLSQDTYFYFLTIHRRRLRRVIIPVCTITHSLSLFLSWSFSTFAHSFHLQSTTASSIFLSFINSLLLFLHFASSSYLLHLCTSLCVSLIKRNLLAIIFHWCTYDYVVPFNHNRLPSVLQVTEATTTTHEQTQCLK